MGTAKSVNFTLGSLRKELASWINLRLEISFKGTSLLGILKIQAKLFLVSYWSEHMYIVYGSPDDLLRLGNSVTRIVQQDSPLE